MRYKSPKIGHVVEKSRLINDSPKHSVSCYFTTSFPPPHPLLIRFQRALKAQITPNFKCYSKYYDRASEKRDVLVQITWKTCSLSVVRPVTTTFSSKLTLYFRIVFVIRTIFQNTQLSNSLSITEFRFIFGFFLSKFRKFWMISKFLKFSNDGKFDQLREPLSSVSGQKLFLSPKR